MSDARLLTALAAVAVLALVPAQAEAQQRQTVTCASPNNELHNCRIPNLVETSVRLDRRLSSAECINGRSWGTQPGLIWVESGCRAEFSYEVSGSSGGGRQEVTCESPNNELHNCRIQGLNEQSVRLVRRLSSAECVNGRSWGTQPNLIWVESGCRAVFSYEAGGGVSQANNPNARMEMNCESQNDRRRECRINDLDLGSVRIERTLSTTPCNKDENWGASRGMIWVDRGCRAVFSYRVNR